jgi:hypothetical protein
VEEDFEEWQLLSRLVPPNNVNVSDLHTLGRRDFDICFDWDKTTISNDVAEEAINFIRNAKSRGVIVENPFIRHLHLHLPWQRSNELLLI